MLFGMLEKKLSTTYYFLVEAVIPISSSLPQRSPVELPVTMTPSERKKAAAFAISARETSAVKAWEECFFLMSVNTRTSSAPMERR